MNKVFLGAIAAATLMTATSAQAKPSAVGMLGSLCEDLAGGNFYEDSFLNYRCDAPVSGTFSKPNVANAFGAFCNARLGFHFQNFGHLEEGAYWRCYLFL